jgi:hypothetical protein
MGKNVRKCTVFLYKIPEDAFIPEFTSVAWSYDSQGPVKGSIKVVVMRRDRTDGHLICYDIPKLLQDSAPQPIKDILAARKYLGVPSNGQLDGTGGKEKILKKLNQRIGLISTKADSINEAKIAHNMMVCQVATFSPICINFSLRECA